MALIKCPECRRMVSNMATSCPNCGYPIAKSETSVKSAKRTLSANSKIRVKSAMIPSNGVVQVKLGMFQSTQSASIVANGRILWSGKTGQIAELKLSHPTYVHIQYQMGMFDGAGSCEGFIDPTKHSTVQKN